MKFPHANLLRANLPEAIDLLMAYVEHRVKEEATKGPRKGSRGWKGSWKYHVIICVSSDWDWLVID